MPTTPSVWNATSPTANSVPSTIPVLLAIATSASDKMDNLVSPAMSPTVLTAMELISASAVLLDLHPAMVLVMPARCLIVFSAMLTTSARPAFNFTTPRLTNPLVSNVPQQSVLYALLKTIVANAIRDSRSQTPELAWPATSHSALNVSSTTSATSATLGLLSLHLWPNALAATSTTVSAVRRPTTAVLLVRLASL